MQSTNIKYSTLFSFLEDAKIFQRINREFPLPTIASILILGALLEKSTQIKLKQKITKGLPVFYCSIFSASLARLYLQLVFML
jgi:hypothetical protein